MIVLGLVVLVLVATLFVSQKPKQDLVFYNLALVYERRGETAFAVQNYKDAYAINPNDFLSCINLENLAAEEKRWDEALHNKAILLAMKKQFREALEINKKMLQLAPDWPPAVRFRERLDRIFKKE